MSIFEKWNKRRKPSPQDKEPKQHSFWSHFFEPVPEDDDYDWEPDDRLYDESPRPFSSRPPVDGADESEEFEDDFDDEAFDTPNDLGGDAFDTNRLRLPEAAEHGAMAEPRIPAEAAAYRPWQPQRAPETPGSRFIERPLASALSQPPAGPGGAPLPDAFADEPVSAEPPAVDPGAPVLSISDDELNALLSGDGTGDEPAQAAKQASAPGSGADAFAVPETQPFFAPAVQEPVPAEPEDKPPYIEQPLRSAFDAPGDMPAVPQERFAQAATETDDPYAGQDAFPYDAEEEAPFADGDSRLPAVLPGPYGGQAFDPRAERPGAYADDALFDDEDEEAEEENIRLFDEEYEEAPHRSDTTRTRIFQTGTSATTRIHINETEEVLRMEDAEKRARARAARKRREEQLERQNRRKKRRKAITRVFGNVAFVLFLIAAIVVALYYGFLLSDVVVMGNKKYSADYIVELSDLQLGRHMLLCDLDAAKENIQEDPYLQVDAITYIFPSRIRIIVSEREEVAGIIGLDYNVIIDKNGYVLSMGGGTDLTGLLQVTGISMTGFQLGQRLGEGNDFSTATLIELIGKLEEYNLVTNISTIDLTTPLAITMTARNGLRIHVGQTTDLDAKMSDLARLLPQFVNQRISTGTLYLSAKGGTVYSSVDHYERLAAPEGDTTMPDAVTYVDNDNDGVDDVTGEAIVTPAPGATPVPRPTATPRAPGGNPDEFSG